MPSLVGSEMCIRDSPSSIRMRIITRYSQTRYRISQRNRHLAFRGGVGWRGTGYRDSGVRLYHTRTSVRATPCKRLTLRACQYRRGRRRDIICACNVIGAGRAVGEVTGLPTAAERLPARSFIPGRRGTSFLDRHTAGANSPRSCTSYGCLNGGGTR